MFIEDFEEEEKNKQAEELAAKMAQKKDEEEDDGSDYKRNPSDLISQAILQIAPSILGAAIGGSGGAQVGIQAGQQGVKSYQNLREKEEKAKSAAEKAKLEKDKEALERQFKAAELGIKSQESAAKIKELQNKGNEDRNKLDKDRNDIEIKLADKFESNPEVKRYKALEPFVNAIKEIASNPNPSGAGDNVIIKNFEKVWDPSSVVRGEEFDKAAGSGGEYNKLLNYSNRLKKGQILDAAQRKEFARLTSIALDLARKQYERTEADYIARATEYGARPKMVVGSYLQKEPTVSQKIDGSTGIAATPPPVASGTLPKADVDAIMAEKGLDESERKTAEVILKNRLKAQGG